MGKHSERTFRAASAWADRALAALSSPALVYDLMVEIATRLVPPGPSRRRLAKKLNCEATMVPEALVCYAAIYMLLGLFSLLCLQGLVRIFAD